MEARVEQGDCRELLPKLDAGSVRLAYLDPPFFTQRVQRLVTRDRRREYSFSDVWSDHEQYADFLHECLSQVKRVLSDDGSLFLHCDRRAAHVARAILDRVFGAEQFNSEIIWQYRRWSNARRALLPAHQTLYLYTKGPDHVFNPIFTEYSPATNVDQILQRRTRDAHGKAVYERDGSGAVVPAGAKNGVPLSDVWDIPYLNPKARERVGYPTQKPIALLERVVQLASNPGDWVLDPCCGSGTTLVAARLLGRRAIGIDNSAAAVELARQRLIEPKKSESRLLARGRETYRRVDAGALMRLADLDVVPVQRNRGMDAILREQYRGRPVAVRVQRPGESVEQAAELLERAGRSKHCELMLLVLTDGSPGSGRAKPLPPAVVAIESTGVQVRRALNG